MPGMQIYGWDKQTGDFRGILLLLQAMRVPMNCLRAIIAVSLTMGVGVTSSAASAQIRASAHNKAATLNNQGLALFQAGQTDAAIALYRQALAIAPNLPEALSNLGFALDKEGKDDEAIAAMQRALGIRPDAITQGNLGLAVS